MKLHRRLSGMRYRGVKNSPQHALKPRIMQCIRVLLAGVTVLTLSACSGGPDNSSNASSQQSTEMVIANALYFDKRTPANFYKEEFQNDTFYSVSHVKNISLLPVSARAGQAVYELASNDFTEALAWSNQAAQYQPSYQQLAANSETMLYYQFTRFDPAAPQFTNIHRVFKANVLDRSGVDRSDENASYKGRITKPGFTAADVKLIVEYLWMFTLSNNYRNAVLESYTSETEAEFVHIMKQARLNLNYNGGCDDVEVFDVRYRIAKDSGFIWKEKVLTDSFSAKRTDNYLEICQ